RYVRLDLHTPCTSHCTSCYSLSTFSLFFINHPPTPHIYTLSLHDALPIYSNFYQAGLRRDAVQPDIEAERKKRDEIEAGKSYCRSEERFSRNAETDLVCRLLLEKKKKENTNRNRRDSSITDTNNM